MHRPPAHHRGVAARTPPVPRETPPRPESWTRALRHAGYAGLAAVVLVFVPIIAVSTVGEPPLEADSAEAAEFLRNAQESWVQAAWATAGIGMLVLLAFVVGLALVLGRAEADPPWRATFALLCGVLVAAYGVLDASWESGAHGADELDDAFLGYVFRVGNLGFANVWLAMAGLAAAYAWVTLEHGPFPRWTAWCALVAAAGLVLSRYLWFVSGLWFPAYALFWVWFVAAALRMVRRPEELLRGSPDP